jgi:TIR domain
MSRLFVSHSSLNNDKAVEVRDWLAKNGWGDVFLDLDPEDGIAAGERWVDALQKAAYRCEVVLALVSQDWLASTWCQWEVDEARRLGKKVIAALIDIDKSQLPPEFVDEQFVDLTGDPQAYRRLKEGLKRAGIDPNSFTFEQGRAPYPGIAGFDEQDAAVFFGRDADILRALDEIRGIAHTGNARIFVLLGASGSGKSSFLRAGLWPRLKRDDLAWLPLPIIRPDYWGNLTASIVDKLSHIASEARFADGMRQLRVSTGEHQLAQAFFQRVSGSAIERQNYILDFAKMIDDTGAGLATLLATLREIPQALATSSGSAVPLRTILAFDEFEQMFWMEPEKAHRFLEVLTKTLTDDPFTVAILAMRSDAFPLLQGHRGLHELPKHTFILDKVIEGSYRALIEGPARKVEPSLRIEPRLADALLADVSGQDSLQLLTLTLYELYQMRGANNELTLSSYDKIGRIDGLIADMVARALRELADVMRLKDEKALLALVRSTFIPHLVQANAAGQITSRAAALEKIPAEAFTLINNFAMHGLLIKDFRQDKPIVAIRHEMLLRQPPFSAWLAEDHEFLLWRERLSQARISFEAKQRDLLTGRELAIARRFAETRTEDEIEPEERVFINNSITAARRRSAWFAAASFVATLVAVAAIWQYFSRV